MAREITRLKNSFSCPRDRTEKTSDKIEIESLQLDSTCLFGAMFEKNIGDSKTFFLSKAIARVIC